MLHCPYCCGLINAGQLFDWADEWQCSACDLIFKNPCRPVQQCESQKDRYYSEALSSIETNGSRLRIYRHILNRLGRHRKGALLDVGSGCGLFLIEAQKNGWSVKGIEPSTVQSEVAVQEYYLDIFRGTLSDFPATDRFDAITFVNSLDFTDAPWEEVKKARHLLLPGGLLYVRFPNSSIHVWIRRVLSTFRLYDQIRKLTVFHRYSFSKRFIERMLSECGFSDIRIFNSPFSDSFGSNCISNPIIVAFIKQVIYLFNEVFRVLSLDRLKLGTSLEVFAVRSGSSDYMDRPA